MATRELIIGYVASEQGEDALALGGALARPLEAKPLVVTVLPQPRHAAKASDIERESDELAATARERLGDLDVSARAIAAESPARGLHGLAEEVGPVAVVVGSAHRGRIGRILLGSVGSMLLTGAPCAIAVAPRGYAERERRALRTVGVAFNGSEEAQPALEAAYALAARLSASLMVIGVVEPVTYGYELPDDLIAPGVPDDQKRYEEEVDGILARATEGAPAGIAAEPRRLSGDPAKRIVEAAEELDLLVVGSRGYGPIRRTLLGAVSAKVMEDAPCPVLVLPRGADTDSGVGQGAAGGSSPAPPL